MEFPLPFVMIMISGGAAETTITRLVGLSTCVPGNCFWFEAVAASGYGAAQPVRLDTQLGGRETNLHHLSDLCNSP